jgi:hypothetical protein
VVPWHQHKFATETHPPFVVKAGCCTSVLQTMLFFVVKETNPLTFQTHCSNTPLMRPREHTIHIPEFSYPCRAYFTVLVILPTSQAEAVSDVQSNTIID